MLCPGFTPLGETLNELVHAQGSPDGEPFVPFDDLDSNNEPVMTISLGGRTQTARAEEVKSLTLKHFSALWTVMHSPLLGI